MRIVILELRGDDEKSDMIKYPIKMPRDTDGHARNTVECFFHGVETFKNKHDVDLSEHEFYMLPISRAGLEKAIELKPQIVTMSATGTFFRELEIELSNHAFMITSAGNTGNKGEGMAARSEWWCAVGAVDRNDKPLWYSSYGLGAVRTCARLPVVNGTTRPGTSSTAPVVAAILFRYYDWYFKKTGQYPSAETTYQFIKENSHDIWECGEDLRTGWGLLRTPNEYTATQIKCRVGDSMAVKRVFKGEEVKETEIDIITAPQIIDGRSYVGVRGLFEHSGAKVGYNANKEISVTM